MSPTIRNWGGNLQFRPATICYPDSEEAIIQLVRRARKEGRRIRVMGAGHSWMPLIQTDDLLVSLDRWAGIEAIDHTRRIATVRAGTRLRHLGPALAQQGLAMENLGDIDAQSIAGALLTGTHGTGIQFGILATQLESITFVDGRGELVSCSRTQQAECFRAAAVSLGTLGIVTRLSLRCVPAFQLKEHTFKGHLDGLLSQLDNYLQAHRNVECYWIPYTKALQIKTWNETEQAPRRGVRWWYNKVLLENVALGALMHYCKWRPHRIPRVNKFVASLISDNTYIDQSYRLFASPRYVRFMEMEYSLPIEQFPQAMRALEEAFYFQRFHVAFPIECRFVRGDYLMLSPATGRNSAYIAVHQLKGMPWQDYFHTVEAIFQHYGGRPHWGKIHTCTAKELAQMYPEWDQFNRIRHIHDPDGIFLNSWLEKIFGYPT